MVAGMDQLDCAAVSFTLRGKSASTVVRQF